MFVCSVHRMAGVARRKAYSAGSASWDRKLWVTSWHPERGFKSAEIRTNKPKRSWKINSSKERIGQGLVVLHVVKGQSSLHVLFGKTRIMRTWQRKTKTFGAKDKTRNTKDETRRSNNAQNRKENIKLHRNIAEASWFPSKSWQVSKDDVPDAPPM